MEKISQNPKVEFRLHTLIQIPCYHSNVSILQYQKENIRTLQWLDYYTSSNNGTIYSCLTSHDVLNVQECVAQSSYMIWFSSLFYCIIFYLMLCLTIIVIVLFVWLCVWLIILIVCIVTNNSFFLCTVYDRYV